jgi:hypothetical protein
MVCIYTKQFFNSFTLLYIYKDNSNCVGKEDNISSETIEEGDAIYLEKQCYIIVKKV